MLTHLWRVLRQRVRLPWESGLTVVGEPEHGHPTAMDGSLEGLELGGWLMMVAGVAVPALWLQEGGLVAAQGMAVPNALHVCIEPADRRLPSSTASS